MRLTFFAADESETDLPWATWNFRVACHPSRFGTARYSSGRVEAQEDEGAAPFSIETEGRVHVGTIVVVNIII